MNTFNLFGCYASNQSSITAPICVIFLIFLLFLFSSSLNKAIHVRTHKSIEITLSFGDKVIRDSLIFMLNFWALKPRLYWHARTQQMNSWKSWLNIFFCGLFFFHRNVIFMSILKCFSGKIDVSVYRWTIFGYGIQGFNWLKNCLAHFNISLCFPLFGYSFHGSEIDSFFCLFFFAFFFDGNHFKFDAYDIYAFLKSKLKAFWCYWCKDLAFKLHCSLSPAWERECMCMRCKECVAWNCIVSLGSCAKSTK